MHSENYDHLYIFITLMYILEKSKYNVPIITAAVIIHGIIFGKLINVDIFFKS